MSTRNNDQKSSSNMFNRKFVTSGTIRGNYLSKNSRGPVMSSKDADMKSSYATNNLIQLIKSKKSNQYLKKSSLQAPSQSYTGISMNNGADASYQMLNGKSSSSKQVDQPPSAINQVLTWNPKTINNTLINKLIANPAFELTHSQQTTSQGPKDGSEATASRIGGFGSSYATGSRGDRRFRRGGSINGRPRSAVVAGRDARMGGPAHSMMSLIDGATEAQGNNKMQTKQR